MIRSIHSFAGKRYLTGKIAPNGGIYTMSESSICMLEHLRTLRGREPNRLDLYAILDNAIENYATFNFTLFEASYNY